MGRRPWLCLATVALVGGAFAANMVGSQLNAIFVRWPGIDKAAHLAGYTLVYLSFYACARTVLGSSRWASVIAFACGGLLGGLDEVVQQFSPNRTVEVKDLAADVVGLSIGWLIARRPVSLLAAPIALTAAIASGFLIWDSHVRLREFAAALRYESAHDFDRALVHYRNALAGGMQSATLYNGLAWVEIESGHGQPNDAVVHAQQALRMQPDNPDFLDTYGWALHKAGRSREALAPLLRAYVAKPDMYCIHYHLGEVYLALSDREKAEAHFMKQIDLRETREAPMAARALQRMKS